MHGNLDGAKAQCFGLALDYLEPVFAVAIFDCGEESRELPASLILLKVATPGLPRQLQGATEHALVKLL